MAKLSPLEFFTRKILDLRIIITQKYKYTVQKVIVMISRFLTTRLQNLRSFRFQINIIILIILFTFSFSTPIAEASIIKYFIPKTADYCPNCAAGHELEFGSPGISLNPASISYNMDSPDYRWEKIEICIFNPPGYHVKRAIITLDIPDTIEYKVNTDATTKFHYNPLTTTFTIENFGNYQRITQCDWFEIRPRIDTHSKNEVINLSYDIEYSEKVFFFTLGSSATSDEPIHGSEITLYSSNHTERDVDISNNTAGAPSTNSSLSNTGLNESEHLEQKSISRNGSIEVTIKNPERSIFSTIQENLWIIAVGSIISSVLLLIYGPGSGERIQLMKRKFRR